MHRLHPYPDVQVMFRRLLIATLIGLLAALAVALFRHAMVVLETLFLGNDSGSLVNAAQSLPAWRRLITPALGGLAAGALLWLWQRRRVARPHAATDYMEALETGDGCFDTPASLVKSLASLLVVVTGSAIGREGAMILLAALAASLFARRFTPQAEWKLWVACGAAAGMASAYHAPLAGSLFIAEILFGTLMLASLGPVVIAAVVALLTTQLLAPGTGTLYAVHLSGTLTATDYALLAAMGQQIQPLLIVIECRTPLPRRVRQPAPASGVVMGQAQVDAKQVVMTQIHRQHPGTLLPGRQRQAGDQRGGAHTATDPLQRDKVHADLPASGAAGPLRSSSASSGKRSRRAMSRSRNAMSW